MGGRGSGRRSWGGRPVVEEGLALDLARIIREGPPSGTMTWRWRENQSASIAYRLELRANRLTIKFATGPERREIEQQIRLTHTYPHFGGRRYWMTCPATGRRCGKLYGHRRSDYFLSRQALGLAYKSQTEDRLDRALRSAQKALERLSRDGDLETVDYLRRPKGLHQATFERLRTKARNARDQYDEIWSERFGDRVRI